MTKPVEYFNRLLAHASAALFLPPKTALVSLGRSPPLEYRPMIAVLSTPAAPLPSWQSAFNAMLPDIVRCARFVLRAVPENFREEAMQDVIANCCVAFSRMAASGKVDKAYPSVLVRFALSQYRCGRRVGNRLSVGDVLSPHAQFHRRFHVESLDFWDPISGEWRDALFEDRRTCVVDQAAFRIDFPAWLQQLPKRDCLVAEALSLSHTTQEVAQRFGLSPGRVSQMRNELRRSWNDFHGERGVTATMVATS